MGAKCPASDVTHESECVMLIVPIMLYSTTIILVPLLAVSCILPLFLFLFCYSSYLFVSSCRCSTGAHNYYFKTICQIITSKSHVWSNESRASFATVRGSFGALSHTLAMNRGPVLGGHQTTGAGGGVFLQERQGLQGPTEWKLDNRILSVNGHKICVFLKRLSTMTCVPCAKVFTSLQALFI